MRRRTSSGRAFVCAAAAAWQTLKLHLVRLLIHVCLEVAEQAMIWLEYKEAQGPGPGPGPGQGQGQGQARARIRVRMRMTSPCKHVA